MIAYSPFDKEIGDLIQNDLQTLIDREISEGWCIEYKSDLPKKSSGLEVQKIAKSVSAFANTKGGWLFYGIDSNSKNIPTELLGIDLKEYRNLADQLSQIITSNINPKPNFHLKEISLESGRSIFVIKVDESPTPPYITSQGVIYQRQNSESSPVNDRYILERMGEKTNEYYEAIERFCSIDYGETQGQSESNQSFLELYLFPLPFNDFYFKDFFTTEFFNQVAARFYQGIDFVYESGSGEQTSVHLNIPFNSIFTAHNSLIIRPLNDEDLIYKITTAELFSNGGLKFTIPLSEFSLNGIPDFFANSETMNYLLNRFSPLETVPDMDHMGRLTGFNHEERRKSGFVNHIKMIDGTNLIYVVYILITKYQTILRDAGFDLNTDIGFRARIDNTWRKFVFFDDPDYLEKIKTFNIPLSPKSEIEIPKFLKGRYYKYQLNEPTAALSIAKEILRGIGLPDSSALKLDDIMDKGAKHFKNQFYNELND